MMFLYSYSKSGTESHWSKTLYSALSFQIHPLHCKIIALFRFCVRQINSQNWGQNSERLEDETVESRGCIGSHFVHLPSSFPSVPAGEFLQSSLSYPSILVSLVTLKYMWYFEFAIHFLILLPLCEMHFSLIPNSLDSYSVFSL